MGLSVSCWQELERGYTLESGTGDEGCVWSEGRFMPFVARGVGAAASSWHVVLERQSCLRSLESRAQFHSRTTDGAVHL